MHDLAALFQKMALPGGERREPAVVDLRDREAGEDFGVASAEALTHLESISDLVPVVFFHLREDFVLEDMVGVGAQRTFGVFSWRVSARERTSSSAAGESSPPAIRPAASRYRASCC